MVKPNYPCSQTALYAVSVRGWQMCADNQAAFFALDPIYTEGYIGENVVFIKTAEGLPDHNARKGNLALLSLEYDKVATDLALMAKYLKNYVERAYADKSVRQIMLKTAGFDYYAKVQSLDDRGITPFMSSALAFVAAEAAALKAVGKMPDDFATRFAAVDGLFDEILARYNAAQSDTKAKTDEKLIATNEVYARVQKMLYDGRFMYLETPERAKPYFFNTIWGQIEPTKNAGINGKTLMPGGKKVIGGVTVTEPLTGKTAVSDKGGSYEIGPFSEDTYTLIFSADGYETQTISGLDVKTGVVKRLNVEMVPKK